MAQSIYLKLITLQESPKAIMANSPLSLSPQRFASLVYLSQQGGMVAKDDFMSAIFGTEDSKKLSDLKYNLNTSLRLPIEPEKLEIFADYRNKDSLAFHEAVHVSSDAQDLFKACEKGDITIIKSLWQKPFLTCLNKAKPGCKFKSSLGSNFDSFVMAERHKLCDAIWFAYLQQAFHKPDEARLLIQEAFDLIGLPPHSAAKDSHYYLRCLLYHLNIQKHPVIHALAREAESLGYFEGWDGGLEPQKVENYLKTKPSQAPVHHLLTNNTKTEVEKIPFGEQGQAQASLSHLSISNTKADLAQGPWVEQAVEQVNEIQPQIPNLASHPLTDNDISQNNPEIDRQAFNFIGLGRFGLRSIAGYTWHIIFVIPVILLGLYSSILPVDYYFRMILAQRFNEQGLEAFSAGYRGEAKGLFEKALKANPDLLEAKLNLAFVHFSNNRLDEAIQLLEPIISKDPDFMAAHQLLVQSYFRQADQGLRAWEEVVQAARAGLNVNMIANQVDQMTFLFSRYLLLSYLAWAFYQDQGNGGHYKQAEDNATQAIYLEAELKSFERHNPQIKIGALREPIANYVLFKLCLDGFTPCSDEARYNYCETDYRYLPEGNYHSDTLKTDLEACVNRSASLY
ncbi:MAG: tetratricopeptide repeat protein [Deinococcales bacterium]